MPKRRATDCASFVGSGLPALMRQAEFIYYHIGSESMSILDYVRAVLVSSIALDLEGAWRVSDETVQSLADEVGQSPEGGWRNFLALLAGTPVLEASRETFERSLRVDDLPDEDAKMKVKLSEAMTKLMIPPGTAAGVFIMLGIHPAWGVSCSHYASRHYGEQEDVENQNGDLFPQDVKRHILGELSLFMKMVLDQSLSEVDEMESMKIGDFIDLVGAARDEVIERRPNDLVERSKEVPPFVDRREEASSWRIEDFVESDWLEQYMIPAGVAERSGVTLTFDTDVLSEVDVMFPDCRKDLP